MAKRLPRGWVRTTLGNVCAVNPRTPQADQLSDDAEVSFVPIGRSGGRDRSPRREPNAPLSRRSAGLHALQEHDVIFAKDNTDAWKTGKSLVATGLKNGVGFGSTEFIVFRLIKGVLPRFILYFLLQPNISQRRRTRNGRSKRAKTRPVKLSPAAGTLAASDS